MRARLKRRRKAFGDGSDFVYVHVEAPDECGHRGEIENKVYLIEKISEEILRPVYGYLRKRGEDFKIMVLPDHPHSARDTHTLLRARAVLHLRQPP